MIWLVAGVALWMAVHLVPSVVPGIRQGVISRLGEMPYKGIFALDIFIALGLIIYGWRSTIPELVYIPPTWGRTATLPLMIIAVFLLGAAQRQSLVKRYLRHPQLTGLVVWSIAHLLANGEQRSLVLFGGLGTWALLEMPLLNRRDGAWVRPEPAPLGRDLIGVVIAIAVVAILIYLHPYFAGVALTF